MVDLLQQTTVEVGNVEDSFVIITAVLVGLSGVLTGAAYALAKRAQALRLKERSRYRAQLVKTEAKLEELQRRAEGMAAGLVNDDEPESLDLAVVDLDARLERVERRLPDPNDVDKVASVNEALLSKGLEDLRQVVAKLDERTLSKWDVATTVFAIFTAMGIVIAAIVGVAQMLNS